jgi:hypothetical protein
VSGEADSSGYGNVRGSPVNPPTGDAGDRADGPGGTIIR